MKTESKPPSLVLKFFQWFCHPKLLKYIEGDLMELYDERVKELGKRKADLKFIIDVLLLCRPGIIRPTSGYKNLNHYGMFKNYVKITVRTLKHNKSYGFINVMGLALGLASTILIFLVVKNELSYDRFHHKPDRTYRVTMYGLDYNPSVSFAIAPAFENDFPEVENVSQYFYCHGALIKVEEDLHDVRDFAYADNQFARIFDLTWLRGNPGTALKEPNAVVLTESMANKYFGKTDVLGRIIRLDNQHDLQVTGVIKDLPSNTHLIFDFLVSWETIRREVSNSNFYAISGGYLYVTLPDNLAEEDVADRLPAFVRKNWGEEIAAEAKLLLQPLTEIHFDKRYLRQVSMPRSKESIYGLSAVAVFIILTACINFVNLATAQYMKRVKEVGIRKALGAFRKQLIFQVLTEITMLVLVAVTLAITAVWVFLPSAKTLLNVRIEASQLLEPGFITVVGGITFATILIAGLYPAFVQSAFQPITALKSGLVHSGEQSYLRKGLVVVQFAITQLLLITTIVAGSQMDFFMNQNIGFDKEAVVTFSTGNKKEVLYQQLKNITGIQEISYASAGPAYNFNYTPFSAPESGMPETDVTELKEIDENYMSMFKMELLAGEPVTKPNDQDTIRQVVVNETLIKRMGVPDPENAIGRRVFIGGTPNIIKGVVRDFQSESKHKKVRALIMFYNANSFWQASVKLHPEHMRETLAAIESVWRELNPEWLFSYEFLDDHIAKLYIQEENTYNAFRIFSVIAIVIGCLGLYGFVSSMAVQRTKEIGIRKVLGASIPGIIALFFNQFIWLIVIGFVIAVPIGWYVVDKWLQEFAYHISIGPEIFLLVFVTTFLIAGLTVGYQSIKAAVANPVKSLRSE
jgi:putative ABC transport system permease protein